MKTIQAGQTLTARSACDQDCIFTAEIIERKGAFVTAKALGNVKRVKVHTDSEGVEFIFALGRYSMAPAFKATTAQGTQENPVHYGMTLEGTPEEKRAKFNANLAKFKTDAAAGKVICLSDMLAQAEQLHVERRP